MRRAVIFAHYDKDNLIDDYVVYYVKSLKDVCDTVVFVSCNEIFAAEKSKLDGIADYIIDEKHDEYDFGSYKRGYLYLKERLEDFDELIFANDSCYGPLFPLKEVFEKMEASCDCDFWGITKNRFGAVKKNNKYIGVKREHLQSYFLVFKKNVFLSEVFGEFISSIKHLDEKNDIVINYEIGLYELLVNNGFKDDVYVKIFYRFNHVIFSLWRELIKFGGMPFVKCSILRRKNQDLTVTDFWQDFISAQCDYPLEIIQNNLERTTDEPNYFKYIPFFVKYPFFITLAIMPGFLKRYFRWAVKITLRALKALNQPKNRSL